MTLAVPAPSAREAASPSAPHRTASVGFSYLRHTGDLDSSETGLGLWALYEFHLSPDFRIGMNLALRSYPGEPHTLQLGYGTVLRHFMFESKAIRPFVQYGLLVQMTFLEDRSGSVTSHDTHFGVGVEGRDVAPGWFLQAGYNLSWLRFFDTSTRDLGYASLTVGRSFSW